MSKKREIEFRLKLGARIKELRNNRGITQSKLALMVNSGQAHIHRIEAGKTSVGIDRIVKISDALDVSVKDLLSFEDLNPS